MTCQKPWRVLCAGERDIYVGSSWSSNGGSGIVFKGDRTPEHRRRPHNLLNPKHAQEGARVHRRFSNKEIRTHGGPLQGGR